MLHRGERVSDVARTLCCARSYVGRWIGWFTVSGVEGLRSLPAGRSRRWPFEHICTLLRELIKHSPGDFGYQRSRWSTELLAIKINEITGFQLHAGTVRCWLPSAGLVWRRPAPTLCIRDPHKDEEMAAIHKALGECSAEHPVFYEDEVDIHLNPNTLFLSLTVHAKRLMKSSLRIKVRNSLLFILLKSLLNRWKNHVVFS